MIGRRAQVLECRAKAACRVHGPSESKQAISGTAVASRLEPEPEPEPEPTMTDEPWRQTRGWDTSVRDELKCCVEEFAPATPTDDTDQTCCCCRAYNSIFNRESHTEIPFFNILLTGQIGSGKSSFYNSVNSLFVNRIVSGKSDAGETAQSLTKEYHIYEIKPHPNASPLPWRICDTMGLDENTTQSYIRNLIKAVEGHVPNKHKFLSGEDFTKDSPGYVQNPTLADNAHCVAIVVDANKVDYMSTNMWNKLRNLRESLISRNIPTYILLSHIDQACAEVSNDVTNVYKSTKIRDTVAKVGKQLMGLPENQIFPVKNYSKELELDDHMDILLLYAMRQMLYSCQGHIENKM